MKSDVRQNANRGSCEQLVTYECSSSSTDRAASQRERSDRPTRQHRPSASPARAPDDIWRRSQSPLPAEHTHADSHAEASGGQDMDLRPDRSLSPLRRAFSASASSGGDGMPGDGYGSLSSRSPSPRRASRSPSRRSLDGAGPGYSVPGGLSCSPSRYQDGYTHGSPSGPRYSPASPRYSPASPRYSPASPRYSPASPRYSPASPRYSPPSPAYNPLGALYSSHSPTYTPPRQRYSPPSPLLRQPSDEFLDRQRYMPISPKRGSYRHAYPDRADDFPDCAGSPDESPPSPAGHESLYSRSLSPWQRSRSPQTPAGRLREGIHSASRSQRQHSQSPERPVRRSAADTYLASRSPSFRQRSISSEVLFGDARVARHSANQSPSPRHSAERTSLSSRSPSPSRTPDTPESGGALLEHSNTCSPPRGRTHHRSNLDTSRLSSSPSGRGHACFSDCSLCREDTPRPLVGDYPDIGRLEGAPRPIEDNFTAIRSSPSPFKDGMDGPEDILRPLEDVLAGIHPREETPRPHGDSYDGIGMNAPSWTPWRWLDGIFERYENMPCQRIQTMTVWLNALSMEQGQQTGNELWRDPTCTTARRLSLVQADLQEPHACCAAGSIS